MGFLGWACRFVKCYNTNKHFSQKSVHSYSYLSEKVNRSQCLPGPGAFRLVFPKSAPRFVLDLNTEPEAAD